MRNRYKVRIGTWNDGTLGGKIEEYISDVLKRRIKKNVLLV
jgi:hypothetical protein